MPRVNTVQRARKARPEYGIEVGDKYFWWKFRVGGMRYSKTYPKPQQLTQSAFYQAQYDITDAIGELGGYNSVPDLEAAVEAIKEQLEELRDEQEEKRDNMPESLQDSPTGELLQERYDACDEMITEFDNIEYPDEDEVKAEVQGLVDDELDPNVTYTTVEMADMFEDRWATVMEEKLEEVVSEIQSNCCWGC